VRCEKCSRVGENPKWVWGNWGTTGNVSCPIKISRGVIHLCTRGRGKWNEMGDWRKFGFTEKNKEIGS